MVMLKLRKPSTSSTLTPSIPATMIYYGNYYGAVNMTGLAVTIKDMVTMGMTAVAHLTMEDIGHRGSTEKLDPLNLPYFSSCEIWILLLGLLISSCLFKIATI